MTPSTFHKCLDKFRFFLNFQNFGQRDKKELHVINLKKSISILWKGTAIRIKDTNDLNLEYFSTI